MQRLVRAHFAQKYAAIPATATLPAVPEKYWYSKELVAYIMAILSTVAYHKSGDPRITCVMDEAYAEALSLFRGMTAHWQAFNDYIVRRMATYLQSWPVDVKPVPAAEPAAAADDAGGVDGGNAEGDDDKVMLTASDNE